MVLGDMFELGKDSISEHKNVVESLLDQDDIMCFFVGKDFYSNKIQRENFHFYELFFDSTFQEELERF
jgi:UDP-N-acetylmuramoyl-tripeptide--D-alanyl-D-alanine ligase